MHDSDDLIQEKGKIFTPVVKKNKIKVRIETTLTRMECFVYIHPDNRLSDELNQTKQFLPVTDLVVLSSNGKTVENHAFASIQINQIVWIAPISEEEKE
jgi:hypothetical protein